MKVAKKLLIPLLSLALFLGLFNTVFFWGYIPSSSMEPTIHKGDVILGLRLFRELHNGDIIIFERDGRYLVKGASVVDYYDVLMLNSNRYCLLILKLILAIISLRE